MVRAAHSRKSRSRSRARVAKATRSPESTTFWRSCSAWYVATRSGQSGETGGMPSPGNPARFNRRQSRSRPASASTRLRSRLFADSSPARNATDSSRCQIVKSADRPNACIPLSLSRLKANCWMVPAKMPGGRSSSGRKSRTRWLMSSPPPTPWVRQAICNGFTPCFSQTAMRAAMVWVSPVPAPPRMSTGPIGGGGGLQLVRTQRRHRKLGGYHHRMSPPWQMYCRFPDSEHHCRRPVTDGPGAAPGQPAP